MDFPAILVLATFVSGLIWGLDRLLWAPKREAEAKEPLAVEYARSFFPIILIVLLLRSFVVEPFRIPSGSMMPTLLVGDFILVNKFAYGLRLPVAHTKILELGEPQRGDAVVFRYPENPRVDYIKRVVGVPGDHVAYINKTLFINGEPARQQPRGTYLGDGANAAMNGAVIRHEDLVGVAHDILIVSERPDRNFEFTVPEGEYFVMGDNRDNSRDSRFWGTVPEANLVGKAFMIWMNWDSNGPVADWIEWGRIGDRIH